MVGASSRAKVVGERPYVQSGTVCMNRHLIKGFDAPFGESTLNPDSEEGWTTEGAGNHSPEFMVPVSVVQVAAGDWNMMEYDHLFSMCKHPYEKKRKKQTGNPQCCVELPSLVSLLSTSELNAQEKWPIFPQTLCI